MVDPTIVSLVTLDIFLENRNVNKFRPSISNGLHIPKNIMTLQNERSNRKYTVSSKQFGGRYYWTL